MNHKKRANEISELLHIAKEKYIQGISFTDIAQKLMTVYALSKEYTNKILRYITEENIERHIVKVYLPDNDYLITEINGSPDVIEKYYNEKIEFLA